jgi:hypothetical protein
MLTDVAYPTISLKVDTPDGKMIVNFIEDHQGNLIDIQILIGKTGYALAAWVNGVSSLLRLLLEARTNLTSILVALSNITSDRFIYTINKVKIRSGIDGLSYAIMTYQKMKYRELYRDRDYEEDRPIFRNRIMRKDG